MTFWITPKPDRGYREFIAWLPTVALDEYSGRWAWVWLVRLRQHKGEHHFTFNSFWC